MFLSYYHDIQYPKHFSSFFLAALQQSEISVAHVWRAVTVLAGVAFSFPDYSKFDRKSGRSRVCFLDNDEDEEQEEEV